MLDGDVGGGGEVAGGRGVDDGAPLKVGLQAGVVAGEDEFLGLKGRSDRELGQNGSSVTVLDARKLSKSVCFPCGNQLSYPPMTDLNA